MAPVPARPRSRRRPRDPAQWAAQRARAVHDPSGRLGLVGLPPRSRRRAQRSHRGTCGRRDRARTPADLGVRLFGGRMHRACGSRARRGIAHDLRRVGTRRRSGRRVGGAWFPADRHADAAFRTTHRRCRLGAGPQRLHDCAARRRRSPPVTRGCSPARVRDRHACRHACCALSALHAVTSVRIRARPRRERSRRTRRHVRDLLARRRVVARRVRARRHRS